MDIERKKNFLINSAYYLLIFVLTYLGLHYFLPIMMPFVVGFGMAWMVVRTSRRLKCNNRWLRLAIAILFYGFISVIVGLLAARGVSALSDFVAWLPELYAMKLEPAAGVIYDWFNHTLSLLDPNVAQLVTVVSDSLMEAFNALVSAVSGFAVALVSGAAAGVPSVVLSILAMIFSTVFTVVDYDRICEFASTYVPRKWKDLGLSVKDYLTGTLFVVIRSYLLIMLLTFCELSILFTVFGIENPIVKAALIAVLDILPVLGTGGIMIPWAVISLILGNTGLGLKLLAIYGIVTVVRNYVEPKIVGAQLGLHPVITLVAMFLGVRLFGFWGLFGLPIAISYFWKRRTERMQAAQ